MAVKRNNGLLRSINNVKRFTALVIGVSLIAIMLLTVCSNSETANEKASSLLLAQIDLRKEQIAGPTLERLEIMKGMGMRVDNLEMQRIFIHLSQELNQSQIGELQSMGLTLYLDSWIPPVGAHPTGFITADMPVDMLEAVAEKDYVIRLETAERQLEPQNGNRRQVE